MLPRWIQNKIRLARMKKGQALSPRKRIVQAFIDRPRRDYSTYTQKSLRWLQDRMEALPVRPPIWKRLRKEQRVGFIAGVEAKKFCFWYDMGMGKTILAIALARYFRRAGVVRRVLVLIPNKVNKYEWANEIKKHCPLTKCVVLRGSSQEKREQLASSNALFVLETYGGLVRLLCKGAKRKKAGKMVPILIPDKTAAKHFLKLVQGIVMDESIMVLRKKKAGSLVYRLCRHIAKHSAIAYALNGTPFGNDPSDMWGQFNVVDEGDTLGKSLGLFRSVFFTETQNAYGGFDYTFDPSKRAFLHKVINNRSIRYEADESTLPGIVSIIKNVPMPKGAMEYYEKAKEQIQTSGGNYRELKNVFVRMRQISSGYIGYADDETGERAQFEFDTNPKLEMLMSIIEALGPQDKIVVFHQFTYSGNMIEREVRAAKIKFARLSGKTKDPGEELTRFSVHPECRVCILQNDSGGFGLDRLKVARYGVYFESPVGTVLRVQTGRRIRRQGSEHARVFMYDLVVPDTVDAKILEAHATGINLFRSIVDGQVKPSKSIRVRL